MKRSEFLKAFAEQLKEDLVGFAGPRGLRPPTALDLLKDNSVISLMKRLNLEEDAVYCEVCGHELQENKHL